VHAMWHTSGYVGWYVPLYCTAVVQLVEALGYRPEGRGFNSPWCRLNFFGE
jgi:hypothetical protein